MQATVNGFNDEMIRRLRQLPGVKSVGLTDSLPTSSNGGSTAFVAEGYVPPPGAGLSIATESTMQGDYLQAMGIPLLASRMLTPADTADTQLVAIINHKLAEHYWPGTDPIGKRMRIGVREMQTPWMTIVGEVADVEGGLS
jgi:putative ABC transport system permease protein